MKRTPVCHVTPLFALATCVYALFCLPSVGSASSPPAGSVHFCLPSVQNSARSGHRAHAGWSNESYHNPPISNIGRPFWSRRPEKSYQSRLFKG